MSVKRERTASMPTSGSTQRSTAPGEQGGADQQRAVPGTRRARSAAARVRPRQHGEHRPLPGGRRSVPGGGPAAALGARGVPGEQREAPRRAPGLPLGVGRADRVDCPRASGSSPDAVAGLRPGLRRRASADTALRRLDHVDEQLGAGHRADAAGFGEIQAATSATPGWTSPTILPLGVCGETPTSRTAAPGFTSSGLIRCGDTGGGDDDVGLPEVGGQVAGAGVALGHRGVLAAPGQQQRHRAADGDAAADDHDLARR